MTVTTTHSPPGSCVGAPEAHTIDMPVALAVAATLKAVADPLRLRMLALIASSPSGEACVCDISEVAEVSQPTVSHHLKVLKDVGVLSSERRGSWVFYRVSPGFVPAVRSLLETFVPAARDAATAPAVMPGLTDADRALTAVADALAPLHPDVAYDQVLQTVRESFTSLARTATARGHLVTLAERFSDQRLTDLAAAADMRTRPPQVLFVCVANAGRSQLAAALVEHYAAGRVIVRSAGSAPAGQVHAGVQPILDALGADGRAFPKPLTDDAVRASDVVITMGCGDVCPVLPGVAYEDWAVGDPAVASAEGIAAIRGEIDERVRGLVTRLVPDLNLADTPDPSSEETTT